MNVVTIVNTARLRWVASEKTFHVNASALGWPKDRWPGEIEVVSSRTGQTLTFVEVGAEYDAKLDEICVRYETPGMALVVVND